MTAFSRANGYRLGHTRMSVLLGDCYAEAVRHGYKGERSAWNATEKDMECITERLGREPTGRAGRPVGWRKAGATESAVGTRLTAEQLAWLDAQPGKTRSAKLRGVIAEAMRRP